MKVYFRSALAILLVGSSATLLTACDYTSLSPGKNLQSKEGFGNPPHGYTNADVNRDSINNRQTVTKPTGEGSATAVKKGSAQDKLNSAPAGDNATSPQTASGKMGSTDQNQPNKTSKTSKDKSGGM